LGVHPLGGIVIARQDLFDRLKLLGIASFFVVALLAACKPSDSTNVPVVAGVPANSSACVTPALYAAGTISKNDGELFSATVAGDVARVMQAIDAGANVNVTGSLKRTPLFAAAFCDRPGVAMALIEKGGHVDDKDADGMSPLHAAVIVGGIDTAKVLIAKGGDINIKDGAGHTPLHLAAATNQTPMVQMLLEKGANAMTRDKNGMNAASLALENGHKVPSIAIKDWQEKLRKAL
jgi:hypothetical protein